MLRHSTFLILSTVLFPFWASQAEVRSYVAINLCNQLLTAAAFPGPAPQFLTHNATQMIPFEIVGEHWLAIQNNDGLSFLEVASESLPLARETAHMTLGTPRGGPIENARPDRLEVKARGESVWVRENDTTHTLYKTVLDPSTRLRRFERIESDFPRILDMSSDGKRFLTLKGEELQVRRVDAPNKVLHSATLGHMPALVWGKQAQFGTPEARFFFDDSGLVAVSRTAFIRQSHDDWYYLRTLVVDIFSGDLTRTLHSFQEQARHAEISPHATHSGIEVTPGADSVIFSHFDMKYRVGSNSLEKSSAQNRNLEEDPDLFLPRLEEFPDVLDQEKFRKSIFPDWGSPQKPSGWLDRIKAAVDRRPKPSFEEDYAHYLRRPPHAELFPKARSTDGNRVAFKIRSLDALGIWDRAQKRWIAFLFDWKLPEHQKSDWSKSGLGKWIAFSQDGRALWFSHEPMRNPFETFEQSSFHGVSYWNFDPFEPHSK